MGCKNSRPAAISPLSKDVSLGNAEPVLQPTKISAGHISKQPRPLDECETSIDHVEINAGASEANRGATKQRAQVGGEMSRTDSYNDATVDNNPIRGTRSAKQSTASRNSSASQRSCPWSA